MIIIFCITVNDIGTTPLNNMFVFASWPDILCMRLFLACIVNRVALAPGAERGRSRIRSQVAADPKCGEFSSRQKCHGFSPEKRRLKLYNGEAAALPT